MTNVIQEFIESLEKVAALGEQVAKLQAEVNGKETEALSVIVEKIKPVMPYIS
jgi:phenylpyruvate tautomerase PptA (4-oxalocrotonate tautomerase family)